MVTRYRFTVNNLRLSLCRSVGASGRLPLQMAMILVMAFPLPAAALPFLEELSEEVPEEVARTEIILEGRSPVDGAPLTAAEYAELQAELEEREYPPELSSELQQLIFLLRIRKLVRTFTPL